MVLIQPDNLVIELVQLGELARTRELVQLP